MPLFALVLAASAFQNLQLLDGTLSIPAHDWGYVDSRHWRYPDMKWQDGSARVHAEFEVKSGEPVGMMIVNRAGLERRRHDQGVTPIAESKVSRAGTLDAYVAAPDDFIVLLKNDAPSPSEVHLTIFLDSAELSSQRRLGVLLISFAVFFGMVGYSALRLRRVFKP
jgi:hypothetical protein